MRFIYFIIFLHLSTTLFGKNFSDFDIFQEKLTKEQIETKITSFLKNDPSFDSYFKLTEDALIVYRQPKEDAIEYILKFAKQPVGEKASINKKSTLLGVKIAIDPGHFGGMFATLEERFIDIVLDQDDRVERMQFDEGTLNFLTASYLKLLLEKEGAIVYLTKQEIGKGAYKDDFFVWLKKNPQFWMTPKPLNKIFREYYNPLDLKARAEKINAFQPDLTIVIHYNSHHSEAGSNHAYTHHNYNLVFIPGAFCKEEFQDEESRYECMRLLVTDDLENSKKLSQTVLNKFSTVLNVPPVALADEARYIQTVCLKVEEGVFARNLVLTRLVHGPICYGETLVQNNLEECQNLCQKNFIINGIICSKRIKEVAESYYEGIKSYLFE